VATGDGRIKPGFMALRGAGKKGSNFPGFFLSQGKIGLFF